MAVRSIARPWSPVISIDAQNYMARGLVGQIALRGPKPPFSLFPIFIVQALRLGWVVTTETNTAWLRSELALNGFIRLGGDWLTS